MLRIIKIIASLAAVLSAASAFAAEDAGSFDPITGYRIAHYRAAVPETVPGGTRIDRDKLDQLIKDRAVLLDVMPSEGGGADPQTGAWRLSRPHQTIPGATWLPDVGKGKLKDGFENYLKANVLRCTDGDMAKPIIVFCQSDCWMGWNVVQRLAKLGYSQIYWYPEGTDGWVEWGDRKLVPAEPVPLIGTSAYCR
ncbi:MAG: rhodanese-like domain-containing protein [Hyphomicrobium sp.]